MVVVLFIIILIFIGHVVDYEDWILNVAKEWSSILGVWLIEKSGLSYVEL